MCACVCVYVCVCPQVLGMPLVYAGAPLKALKKEAYLAAKAATLRENKNKKVRVYVCARALVCDYGYR